MAFQKGNTYGFKKGNIPICPFKKGNHTKTEFKKGNHVKTEFKQGCIPSSKTRQKISKNHKGMLGIKHTEKAKIKMSLSHLNPSEETRRKLKMAKLGDKNPKWIDGRSHEPYPRDFIEKRTQILQRDNFTCQLCGDRIIERRKIKDNPSKNWLAIHHVDYNKKNNNLNNLITLCHFCNISVNKDRIDWTNYFQNQLNK